MAKGKIQNKSIYYIVGVILLMAITFLLFMAFKEHKGPTVQEREAEVNEGDQESADKPSNQDSSDEFNAAVASARIVMESDNNKDIVKVIVEKTTRNNNRDIIYKYEWIKNGQSLGAGSDSISGFKRGDKLAVKITPYDGDRSGKPRTIAFDVQNSSPKVFESRDPQYDGKVLSFQINASDPDGDALSYELLSGPEGMTIDNKSGKVNWIVKENSSGEHPVKVKITDGHGGETTYQLTPTIPKASPTSENVPKSPN